MKNTTSFKSERDKTSLLDDTQNSGHFLRLTSYTAIPKDSVIHIDVLLPRETGTTWFICDMFSVDRPLVDKAARSEDEFEGIWEGFMYEYQQG